MIDFSDVSMKKEDDSNKFIRPIQDLTASIASLHGLERATDIMSCFQHNLANALLQTLLSLLADYKKLGTLPQRAFSMCVYSRTLPYTALPSGPNPACTPHHCQLVFQPCSC